MPWYYQPDPIAGQSAFFGDPMPYFDGQRFHLYYLLDQEHHTQNNGLGNHRVAHLSTADLQHWTAHPVALSPGAPGAVDQHTICTGSVVPVAGRHRFYYSTRMLPASADPKTLRQAVCIADSPDAITFHKSTQNPILTAPEEFEPRSFRDPFVFRDEANGLLHMLVTSARRAKIAWRNGVLLRYTSLDHQAWTFHSIAYEPGTGEAPECAELFEWGGVYYLFFSIAGIARYRFGPSAFGPWTTPEVDTLDGPWANVFRTAPFWDNRRIAVGFIGTREGDLDNGRKRYAGKAVFRELFQNSDGTLRAQWLSQMHAPGGFWTMPTFEPVSGRVSFPGNHAVELDAVNTLALAQTRIPITDGLIKMKVIPGRGVRSFGISLRAQGDLHLDQGYHLTIDPGQGRVKLTPLHVRLNAEGEEPGLFRCKDLDQPIELEVLMEGDIIDISINRSRVLVNRYPQVRGPGLYLWALEGKVRFENVQVAPVGASFHFG